MPIDERGLSEEARRAGSPGYVTFTQKPEVLETQPEGKGGKRKVIRDESLPILLFTKH